jgi:EAL domain-containing protein (putative c-di-GMP-specific phosphodiesterase class I)
LNIPVLAEGVETEQDLDFLRDERCTSVQGFLFGKPMPLIDVNRLIDLETDGQTETPEPSNTGVDSEQSIAA